MSLSLARLFYLPTSRDQQAPLCPDQITVASCWKRGPQTRSAAPQGSSGLREAPHGFPRLPVRAAVSFAYVAVTGDVLSLSLWEEWRSNYVGGPETRLQVCVCVCVRNKCVRREGGGVHVCMCVCRDTGGLRGRWGGSCTWPVACQCL